ncbi:MAG: Sir2 family NAD-dependent protein deacetylase [Hafnia sp.]
MKIMMITGAGISTGSGLSTYRGADGRYTQIEEEVGMPVEQLLSPATLKTAPELVWKYWLQASLAMKAAQPSATHRAIKALADTCDRFLEVTQNVDGLSLKAGMHPEQLIELHGTYRRHYCTECKSDHGLCLATDLHLPPKCYRCRMPEGALVRPNVVMFGENINEDHYDRALAEAATTDLLLITGTSLQFGYLIAFISKALVHVRHVVYLDPQVDREHLLLHTINPALDAFNAIHFVKAKAEDVLPQLAEKVKEGESVNAVVRWLKITAMEAEAAATSM